ncbi:proton myo-inositol cotransporter protein [Pochonia chlamydosporia 170]|uniref:Proton myo-inositol cotransporter protein n=1 Tax=Pochonia chlamydosporia 170 TaxID=1380566 RepID=A0A179F071_METCM|nr:proton myo-inositol cotransporter protein [Pochonia chlamydosporia 170]OAQ58821.1 proton myo-inositol cotransporter protein [Pochonia chlamydosporia 170]
MDQPESQQNTADFDKAARASHIELAPTSSSSAAANVRQEAIISPNAKDAMPPTSEDEANMPLWTAMRQYPKIVWCFASLTIISVGWGFDLVLIGSITAVRPFQKDYGQYYEDKWIIPALWLSLWSASTPIGMVIGSIWGGLLQDRIGRRWTLMAGSFISAIAVAIIFCSYLPESIEGRRTSFFIGKIIQGTSGGMLKSTAITYISETSPVSIRAPAMGLFPMGNLLGQLIGAIVVFFINNIESHTGYLGAFGAQWLLAVAPFILACVIPESPAYLESKDKREDASRAAYRLFAPKTDPLVVLAQLRETLAEERAILGNASYITCFRGRNTRRTMLIIMVNFFPSMFGLELLSKSSYFIQTVGMPSSQSLIFLIAGIVAGCIGNLIGMYILSRVGRRVATLSSLGVTAVLWVGMGISGSWTGPAVYFFACGIMTAVIVVCSLGVWPAVYAISGETSSLQLRAKTQAIGQVVQQASSVVMQFVLPFIFNPDSGDLGVRTGFVFAGTCVIAFALTWFFLPEMKGRSTLELDQMFNLDLPAKEFKKWRREHEE